MGTTMVGGMTPWASVDRQAAGETGAGWSDYDGGASRHRDLVRHTHTEGVGRVGRLGWDCNRGRA
jgi:hypothetical protein